MKDEKKTSTKVAETLSQLREQSTEQLGPGVIGRQVLTLLEAGEPLSVERLRQSLADMADGTDLDAQLARWAVARIDDLI